MFNFFKKNKDKDTAKEENNNGDLTTTAEQPEWGVPVKRKMSRKEEAAEAAEAVQVERRNRERRDMYRLPGTEQIISDPAGRHFALRVEDNSGPQTIEGHPPLSLMVFWGARELAHINAEILDNRIKVLNYKTERGYEGWSLPAQLLTEAEKIARSKGAKEVCFPGPANLPDWDEAFFTQSGFQLRNDELVKTL